MKIRSFFGGNINIYKATGNIALEISAIDQMSTEDIETLYQESVRNILLRGIGDVLTQ